MPKAIDQYKVQRVSQVEAAPVQDSRKVSVVAMTDNPCLVFDWGRGEIVLELLEIGGVQFPDEFQFRNSHRSNSVDDVKGIVKKEWIKRGELTETNYITGNPVQCYRTDVEVSESESGLLTKFREHIIKDVSIGYNVLRSQTTVIEPDETRMYNGRELKNSNPYPLLIRHKTFITELSAVPEGADDLAKAYRAKIENNSERNTMPDEKTIEEARKKEIDEAKRAAADESAKNVANCFALLENFRTQIEQKEYDTIRAKIGVGITPDLIRADILDVLSRKTTASFKAGGDQTEKDAEVITANLLAYSGRKITDKQRDMVRGRDDLPRTYQQLVRYLAAKENIPVSPYAGADEVYSASIQLRKRDPRGEVFFDATGNKRSFAMSPASLQGITSNVLHMEMTKGFDEEPSTFQAWAEPANATDFREWNFLTETPLGDWKKVLQRQAIEQTQFGDFYEKVYLDTYGQGITIDRQTMIDDRFGETLNNSNRIGKGAKNKLNRIHYDLLTTNTLTGPLTSEDGYRVFDESNHVNFNATGGVLTNALFASEAMRLFKLKKPVQAGSVQTYMGLPPRIFLSGINNFYTYEQLRDSPYDVTTAASTAKNLVGGAGMTWVQDAYLQVLLTAASKANAWYLASGPFIRTLYLDGKTSPTIRSKDSEAGEALGMTWDAYMDFGCGAMNWRKVVLNDGD